MTQAEAKLIAKFRRTMLRRKRTAEEKAWDRAEANTLRARYAAWLKRQQTAASGDES